MSNHKRWLVLIIQFLTGQSCIRLINIVVGLTLLRLLSIEEFALYVLSLAFLQAAALTSDMGLSQAINTFGASLRESPRAMGLLYRGACYFSYRLYWLVAIIVIPVAMISMAGNEEWSWMHIVIVLLLVLVTVRIQITYRFKVSILNVHHQSKGLFYAGSAESMLRLILLPLCVVWPLAMVALLINALGVLVGKVIASYYCRTLAEESVGLDEVQNKNLEQFITPLMPVLIYHALQNQLSFFLLGIYGYTTSIAEVGALGRLGQLIGVLMLLNGFLIQPVFSRIKSRTEFIKKTLFVLMLIVLFSSVCMATVYWLPQWWLLIIGSNYSGLEAELPIAISIGLFTLLGGTLYTLVISRKSTVGQIFYVITALLGQVIFLSANGVVSTHDALLLNLVPIIAYTFVQLILLIRVLFHWKGE